METATPTNRSTLGEGGAEQIIKILSSESYVPRQRHGAGELYEELSVNRRLHSILKSLGQCPVYLAANKDNAKHNPSGEGFSLDDLAKKMSEDGYEVVDKGFTDSPPWQKTGAREKPLLSDFAYRAIFRALLIFEPLWKGPTKSHMIYVVGRRGRT